MGREKKTDANSTASANDGFASPFAGLASMRPELPPGAAPPPPSASKVETKKNPPGFGNPQRAVVRLEKKGRGGKEVTVIEKLGLAPPELERWLKALKTALGTGGAVEPGYIIVQGDQRERVRAFLTAHGVERISVG